MGIAVFLISTPSQAFFLDMFGKVEPGSVLIITAPSKKKRTAITKYLNRYKWSRILNWKIPRSNSRSEYWKVGWIQWKCFKFVALNKNKIDKIFIGSYANIYHRNFVSYFAENLKIHLVYDGLQVLAVNENRKKGIQKFKNLPLLYRLLYYRNSKIEHLNYIVPFNFKVSKNDSVEVFQVEQEKRVTYNKENFFFIGQPLVNIKAVSLKYYLEALESFVFQNKNKVVFYVPHPRESKAKINLISKICQIFNPGKVFEEYYLETDERPQNVASFYSSVLLNLYAIDKNVNLISISIPYDKLLHPRFENILKPIYRSFGEISEERFQIINLS